MINTTALVKPLQATLVATISLVVIAAAAVLATLSIPSLILMARAAPPASSKTTQAKGEAFDPAKDQGKATPPPAPKSASKTAQKMVDGWIINQAAKLYGNQILTVSPIGIKSANPKTGVCVVMTPPFDMVTMYSDQNHSIFQSPLKTFRSPAAKALALFNSLILGESPMIKVGTDNIHGFKIVKYQTTKEFSAKQALLRKTDKVPSSNPRIIDSQSTEDFHLAPGAGLGLCKLYGIPLVPGIPLYVECKDMDLSRSNYLESHKYTKTKVSARDFALPLGYRKLKGAEEIMQSNVNPDAMQLFGK
jgi:hypothetical protein